MTEIELNDNAVKWYLVYRELAKALLVFQTKNPSHTGSKLYDLCIKDEEFRANNLWIVKFKTSFRVESIDPIHVYASFNNNKLQVEQRIKLIHIYFRLLSIPIKFKNIDFTGCPAPMIVKIISARKEKVQQDIWLQFRTIYPGDKSKLNANTFNSLKNWYGIDINSFTIFLFWVNADNYLPLDKNTISVLINNGVITTPPNNITEYLNLLFRSNTNIFRNLALISYDLELINSLSETDKNDLALFFKIPIEKKKPLEINNSSIDFKILGIRPLEGISKKHLKTLARNEFYSFYKAYRLEKETFIYDESKDSNLFDLPEVNLKVSVSSIVGKNGTGKSTILELLFLIINNVAYSKLSRKPNSEYGFKSVPDVFAELYFKTDTIYKIKISGPEVEIFQFVKKANKYKDQTKINIKDFDLRRLFYTLNVNYSLYSLNSLILGRWIDILFHKNDAYQLPIVLEPFRKEGNIDINVQEQLVKSRLLANIVEREQEGDVNSFRQLSEFFKAKQLRLKLDITNLTNIKNDEEARIDFEDVPRPIHILRIVLEKFDFTNKSCLNHYSLEDSVYGYALKYILKKLYSIAFTYEHYNKYLNRKKKSLINIDDYVDDLLIDKGHITYKLRQAINFLKYNYLDKKKELEVDIEEYSDKIENVKISNESKKLLTIELIPPPFYNVEIVLFDYNNENETLFDSLSSGEKQKIYSANSILYHLKNIDSVVKGNKGIIHYRYVNIVLDEVELYFHPEMQRTYLNYLLNVLKKIEFSNITNLNFTFVTHSPFIISDIPNSNILFLEKTETVSTSSELELKTFGANIHKLLIDGFFMKQTIGDFALTKINEIIALYDAIRKAQAKDISSFRDLFSKKKKEFYFILENIGEDYIKGVVRNHLFEIEKILFGDSTSEEILLLEKELKKLKSKQNAKNKLP